MTDKKYYINEWQLQRLNIIYDEFENEMPDLIARDFKSVLEDIEGREAIVMAADNLLYLKESFVEYRDGIEALIAEIDEELKSAGVQEGEE